MPDRAERGGAQLSAAGGAGASVQTHQLGGAAQPGHAGGVGGAGLRGGGVPGVAASAAGGPRPRRLPGPGARHGGASAAAVVGPLAGGDAGAGLPLPRLPGVGGVHGVGSGGPRVPPPGGGELRVGARPRARLAPRALQPGPRGLCAACGAGRGGLHGPHPVRDRGSGRRAGAHSALSARPGHGARQALPDCGPLDSEWQGKRGAQEAGDQEDQILRVAVRRG
mmetsp:Transcript_3021/g.4970  ORF Transcript_3021/g.4970 Transcript_3021/m.4970 type:complete len:223 (-) Transcript_3021:534-1202(-)